ncbi:MAG: DUF4159 domain-containing protein [Hyphomicrobiales bacterium]|nr:DUF4159 domain-containing protein [Hyphomicrobiales bacterium]
MTIGMLGFLQPWILTALIALPVIWLLLRFTPPRPLQVAFPPIRLLLGLSSEEETPARSPWWLTLLRLIIAALIILALAGPILNPDKQTNTSSNDLLIVVDNGWTAASRWERRRDILLTLLQSAERNGQTVRIAATADKETDPASLAPLTPGDAQEKAAGLEPMPYDGDRESLASKLSQAFPDAAGFNVVWLSDGIDNGDGQSLAAVLQKIADGGDFSIMTDAVGEEALGIAPLSSAQSGLVVNLLSPGGAPRSGRLIALNGRGERLAETEFAISADAQSSEVAINLPLELRNQITRIEIDSETAAGAVYLLDSRSLWQRFGIISGEAREAAQPLLSPTHYLERALAPYGEVIVTNTGNVAQGSDALLERKPSVMILANIGQLVEETETELKAWVEKGGMLLRFAGPRLEKGGDTLLPVPLRQGGRALGGALSWREPQKLAEFEEGSPFFGLEIPADVQVNRQVLADPVVELRDETQVWARLQDGTPLVTASQLGDGWLVLFHVTASSSWSNLPISGLFVEMLRRTTELSNVTGARSSDAEGNAGGSEDNNLLASSSSRTAFLTPWQTLDGYGRLGTPPVTANALPASDPGGIRPGPRHPPGFYGQPGRTRALNIMQPDSTLLPLDPSGLGAQSLSYQIEKPFPLMPWLLLAAFGLFAMDALITLILMSGGLWRRRAAQGTAAMVAAILLTAATGLTNANVALAQDSSSNDEFALQATLSNRLGFVLTGDATTDDVSQKGLSGLSKVIAARTAIEPGEPMGVNIDTDELVFFPVLYWPVLDDARPLSEKTLAKVDAYMKQGGMIVFDTKDQNVSFNLNMRGSSQWSALNRLIGKLDTPRLEPVPDGHVLTKAFYLLNGFPGRWHGGALWVEARASEDESGERRALKADGVSSLLITSNDLAGAWAFDTANRPVFAVVPGGEVQREMAFRTGINIVMYALTGNYKADQVHVPALLERLGQ